jgi:putative membrane protein
MKAYLIFFIKGMAMGAADVVPGVSGGTVALLVGIYERLLKAVKSVDAEFAKMLLSFRVKDAIEYADLKFLGSVAGGIALSILSLGKLFSWLYQNYELLTMSFFFGLIVASSILITAGIKERNFIIFLLFALGFATAGGVAFLSPSSENPNMLYLFLCGAVAISAMILPGISGSFILLIMGNYFLVLTSLYPPQFAILLPFGAGVLLGMALFSRFLSWLMKRYEMQTLSLMSGFVVGSLIIIYPWKEKIIQKVEFAGKVKEKTVGYIYQMPDMDAEFFTALGTAFLGFLLVMGIEKIGKSFGKSEA